VHVAINLDSAKQQPYSSLMQMPRSAAQATIDSRISAEQSRWSRVARRLYEGSRTRKMLLNRIKIVQVFVALTILSGHATLCLGQDVPTIHDGPTLLSAMHDRYKDVWYETVAFQENAIYINPDGTTKAEIWDEILQVPGKLRINSGASSDGNGSVFADGLVTTFRGGKQTVQRPYVHMLLVLGFDVYRQDPKTTIDQVQAKGFDLTQLHEETWEGESVYVIGAAKGDLKSNQFWVEKKRLLFVRLIQADEREPEKIEETRFRDYRKLGEAWISARVEFYTNGKNVFNEDYFNIRPNVKLDPAIFDPKKFTETSPGQYLGK
jgi:hypothetical protein